MRLRPRILPEPIPEAGPIPQFRVPAVPEEVCALLDSTTLRGRAILPRSFWARYALIVGRVLSCAFLDMTGTDPSEAFLDLNSVSEPSTAGEICSRLARVTNRHAGPRNHLRLVASNLHDANAAGTSLPAERINQCMLLLLLICVALAGFIVGAVGYLVSE
jgi:hypothetical protein